MAAWRMIEDGGTLRIEHPARAPLTIGVEGLRFVVRSGKREVGRFSCLDVRAVAQQACEALRQASRGSRYTVGLSERSVPHPMVVAGRLLSSRARLLAAVDPQVRAVWDRLAPFVRDLPQLACADALYRDAWIVRDVLQYHAAAVALAYVETGLRPAGVAPEATDAASEAALLDALRDWRGLFSPTGRAYRTLNRTLMGAASGVPPELLCRLRRIELPRPYTDPLELTTFLLAHGAYDGVERPRVAESHLRAIARANAAQIRAAVARIAHQLELRARSRRPADLERALAILADYPEPYHGPLPGLVERALRWHRVAPDLRAEVACLGGLSMPTRRPPVALPDDPRIVFLPTVGAVVEEGERMRHCVGSYARRAVTGSCYLFHVEYKGASATVQVDRDGRVAQACGPRNARNPATTWGSRRLGNWAMGLNEISLSHDISC
jgi:hypothetical protein